MGLPIVRAMYDKSSSVKQDLEGQHLLDESRLLFCYRKTRWRGKEIKIYRPYKGFPRSSSQFDERSTVHIQGYIVCEGITKQTLILC